MATLKPLHKEFIVKQLACFQEPTQVVELVKEEFDLVITRQQVNYYNPNTSQGSAQLADKWKRLYSVTRDKFLDGAIQIPIAHKMYRMNELQKMYKIAFDEEKYGRCQSILEQAAKEMGGAYEDIQGKLGELANQGGGINLYQQINQKITQINNNG